MGREQGSLSGSKHWQHEHRDALSTSVFHCHSLKAALELMVIPFPEYDLSWLNQRKIKIKKKNVSNAF